MATISVFLVQLITLSMLGDLVESFEFLETMVDLLKKLSAAPQIIYTPGPNSGSPAVPYYPNGQLGQMQGNPMQGNLRDRGPYPAGLDFSNIFQIPAPQAEKRLMTNIMADALSQLDKPAPYQSDLPELPSLGGILRSVAAFLTGVISSSIVPQDVPNIPSNNPYNYNPYGNPNTAISNNDALKMISNIIRQMSMLNQHKQNQMLMQANMPPRDQPVSRKNTDSSKTIKTTKNVHNADSMKPIRKSGLYMKNTDMLKHIKNIEPQKNVKNVDSIKQNYSELKYANTAERKFESRKNTKNSESRKNIKNTRDQKTIKNTQSQKNFRNAESMRTDYRNIQPDYRNIQANNGYNQANYANNQANNGYNPANYGNDQANYGKNQAVRYIQIPNPWEMLYKSLTNVQAAAYPVSRRSGGCGGK